MMPTRMILAAAAVGLGLAGCLSPETIQRIEGTPGQEGTGIFLSRLPEVIHILATYSATEHQREVADARAQATLRELRERARTQGDGEIPDVLAVDTEPDDRSQGVRSVMLWDTQTEEILGNDVYDVEEEPTLGDVAMWNQVSARYVGRGAIN